MSFEIKNLTPIQNGKNGFSPVFWMYYNNGDNILEEKYFDKLCGFKNNDLLLVYNNVDVEGLSKGLLSFQIVVDETTKEISLTQINFNNI